MQMAPGYQPVGMRDSSSPLPSVNSISAMAFWEPLQTQSVRPSRLKVRALGAAPKRSAGVCLGKMRPVKVLEAVSRTAMKSSAAQATQSQRPSGERARPEAWRPVTSSEILESAERSMMESEPSLAAPVRGSTRTMLPRPAWAVGEDASGRRPPQLLT